MLTTDPEGRASTWPTKADLAPLPREPGRVRRRLRAGGGSPTASRTWASSSATGLEVPQEELLLWQDPLPAATGEPIGADDVATLKQAIADTDLTVMLVKAAQRPRRRSAAATSVAAPTVPGARLSRRAAGTSTTLPSSRPSCAPRGIHTDFNGRGGRAVSLLTSSSSAATSRSSRPLQPAGSPSRCCSVQWVDASQEETDAESFGYLEPKHDGFRNYRAGPRARRVPPRRPRQPARPLGSADDRPRRRPARPRANTGGLTLGVLTDCPGTLTNDFFVNLLESALRGAHGQGG